MPLRSTKSKEGMKILTTTHKVRVLFLEIIALCEAIFPYIARIPLSLQRKITDLVGLQDKDGLETIKNFIHRIYQAANKQKTERIEDKLIFRKRTRPVEAHHTANDRISSNLKKRNKKTKELTIEPDVFKLKDFVRNDVFYHDSKSLFNVHMCQSHIRELLNKNGCHFHKT